MVRIGRGVAVAARINVSTSRGTDVIAREIVRRLFPDYLPAHEDFRKRIAERQARHDATEQVASQVREAFQASKGRTDFSFSFYRDYYGDGEVNYGGDKVSVQLRSLPLDLALRIAQTMTDYDAEVRARG